MPINVFIYTIKIKAVEVVFLVKTFHNVNTFVDLMYYAHKYNNVERYKYFSTEKLLPY